MDMMVSISDLWKRYLGGWALQGVSLDVEKGRVLGVLGENGSGKSTMFRILAGVTRPSKGTVRVMGKPVGVETKQQVAYLPEIDPFYDWMRIDEQMAFLSVFYPGWDMDKTRHLISFMGLDGNKKIGALSRGQKARLKVIFAFSWPCALVIMDEPFGSIDPPSRRRMMDALFNEFRLGEQTILISTHLVDEIESFIEDVVFMKNGEVAISGSVEQVREEQGKSLSEVFELVVT
jgi:ABC-2 type transport system ATP-binding protein